MYTDTLSNKVVSFEKEYKNFMSINSLPEYILQAKRVSLSVAERQGFDTPACTFYSPASDQHTLVISTNIAVPRYILFHEFTHILDTELYAKGDKARYACLSGFTEYHASQVELVSMLNVESIHSPFSFTMDTKVETLSGQKSVSQYLDEKFQHAHELFSRSDFPANIETLKSALGVFYNYLGLRSICEMFSLDYNESCNYSIFFKHIPFTLFTILNRTMHGWLTPDQIELSNRIYSSIIFPLIKKYQLA